MTKYFYILSIVTLSHFLLFPKQAHAVQCHSQYPIVTMKSEIERVQRTKTQSVEDLTHSLTGQRTQERGGAILGVHKAIPADIMWKPTFDYEIKDGQVCLYLTHLEGIFKASPHIEIADNFRPGTCEYSAVVNHEQGHARVLRRFHRRYAPKMKQELKRIAYANRSSGPIAPEQVQAELQKMSDTIKAGIVAYRNEIIPIYNAWQAELDTPEAYARDWAQCTNWDKRLGQE